jgi:hypothetical protein
MTLTKKKRLNLINQVLSQKQDLKNKYMNEAVQKQNKNIEQMEYFKPITRAIKEQPTPQPAQPVTHNYLVPALNYDENLENQNIEASYQVQDDEREPIKQLIGDLAAKSILKADDNKLGLYHTTDDSQNINTFIGNSPVYLRGNDLAIDFDEGLENFAGTLGIWHLLTKKDVNESHFTPTDLENYKRILIKSHALYQGNSPNSKRAKSSKSQKWMEIGSKLWSEINPPKTGRGIVFLSSDPNELVGRLQLLIGSKEAGNSNTMNEISAILKKLIRMNIIDTKEFELIYNKLK